MISKIDADGNTLGRVLALAAIVAVGIWLGRICTGSKSYCPLAIATGHCPFDSVR